MTDNRQPMTEIGPDATLNWTFEVQAEVTSSPAIGADGTTYLGSDDGYLYATGSCCA